jgi:pyruvate,orthophosphate dikinase
MSDLHTHDLTTLDPADVDLLGGKGAGLGRMHRLGLPVPPAFVIDTAACEAYRKGDGSLPDGLVDEVAAAMDRLASRTGKAFSDPAGTQLPLLVAVRSGAKISMPGMMDTVLNLGLDRQTVLRLADASGDPSFAVDTWMRFWTMFADIVLDVDGELLAESVAAQKAATAADLTAETARALEERIVAFLEAEGVTATTDPREQLVAAIRAVFSSWDSRRAKAYRAHHGIPDDLGTAVVVQAMVFGNVGGLSGSGVAFTRDPKTGENRMFGEFLAGGQGEEVVAGTKTPVDLADPRPEWAEVTEELARLGRLLEKEYADALDLEFTVESGTLYLLQVRAAKRTAAAAVRTAGDLVAEGLITPAAALHRVTPDQVRKLVAPEFDQVALATAGADGSLVVQGVGASPGHGSGEAILDADRAAQRAAEGRDVVLVRPTTSPQDLPGMLAAQAVVTARGGATSHAAVVSRALDKPCVVGCGELDVRPDEGTFAIGGRTYREGTFLSVDGTTGSVYAADIPRVVPEQNLTSLVQLLGWADEASRATVWVSASSASGVRSIDESGVGVVGLTDLMLAAGSLGVLLDALSALSVDPRAPIADQLTTAIRAGLDPLLRASLGRPVALRLPVLTSARARRSIGDWASLSAELLRPLGSPALLDAYLGAIAAAVRSTGHTDVTVLIGGVTAAAELSSYCRRAGDFGITPGAVLQNVAVLSRPAQLTSTGAALWVDLHELNRTAHGYPAELLFTMDADAATGGDHAPAGAFGIAPVVEDLLASLVAADLGATVGVDLSGTSGGEVAPLLYGLGFRRFATTPAHAQPLRLQLGQAAAHGATFAH